MPYPPRIRCLSQATHNRKNPGTFPPHHGSIHVPPTSKSLRKIARPALFIILVLLCGFIGWWLAKDLESAMRKKPVTATTPPPVTRPPRREPIVPLAEEIQPADQFQNGTTIEVFSSCHPSEIILRFPSDETFHAFLAAIPTSKVRLLGQLDPLQAMRLGFDDIADLDALISGENISIYRSLPSLPTPAPPAESAQRNFLGFGNQVIHWLGADGDRSRWGAGVKIAVIDSGIVPHPGLPQRFRSIEITPFGKDLDATFYHGTAVASLIAGTTKDAPGIAPAADLISIRVMDDQRKTDAFAVAAGLLAAIDEGAQLINLSLGTNEDNPLLRGAVSLAQSSGAVIIASSGNSALDRAAYPANYPGVISVGAVDARGVQLDFSNFGDHLSLTAPGYLINAAAPGGKYIRVSGTSTSAPLVTGAIAAVMSSGSGSAISVRKATEIVLKYCDEAGIPGPDSQYGSGILNLGRIIHRDRPGIVDAAITHQQIVRSSTGSLHEIQVTLQNRGTTSLVNILAQISTPSGPRRINVTTLAPCEIHTLSIPIDLSALPAKSPVAIESAVFFNNSAADIKPLDNQRLDQLIPE